MNSHIITRPDGTRYEQIYWSEPTGTMKIPDGYPNSGENITVFRMLSKTVELPPLRKPLEPCTCTNCVKIKE